MNSKGNLFNFPFNFWNDLGDKIKFTSCCSEFGLLPSEDEMTGKEKPDHLSLENS